MAQLPSASFTMTQSSLATRGLTVYVKITSLPLVRLWVFVPMALTGDTARRQTLERGMILCCLTSGPLCRQRLSPRS